MPRHRTLYLISILTIAGSFFLSSGCSDNLVTGVQADSGTFGIPLMVSQDKDAPEVEGNVKASGDWVTLWKGSSPSSDPDAKLRTFSFDARAKEDGETSGQWNLDNRWRGRTYVGEITCLVVITNHAYVAGYLTDVDPEGPGAYPGYPSFFEVTDNGRAKEGLLDLASGVHTWYADGWDWVPVFCEDPVDFIENLWGGHGLYEVEEGDMKVKK